MYCLRYVFVPFRFFVIRHWCRVPPLHGGLLLVRCCSYRCCWLNTAVLQRVNAAKVVHQVRGYYQSWRGRRSCIICRRHWSDYGQTYNIQKTAILANWLFLFYLQFPRSLRHSFSAYEKESSRPARDNDMAQPNMILLWWLLACHCLRC